MATTRRISVVTRPAPVGRRDRPDWLRAFDRCLMGEPVAAVSRHSYLSDVQAFLHWAHARGNGSPLEIAAADVLAYRDLLLFDERLALATVRRKLSALRRFFAWLRRDGHITCSPLDAVKSPAAIPTHRSLDRPWSEVNALIAAARTTGFRRDRGRNELIVTLLAHTGLRLAELSILRWGDVRLEAATLDVRRQNRMRRVPLDGAAHHALLSWWRTSGIPADASFVLTGTTWPLAHRSVQHALDALTRRAGLKGRVGPNVLRHTFAVRYLSFNPGDLAGLAGVLGHASVSAVASYSRPVAHVHGLEAGTDLRYVTGQGEARAMQNSASP